MFLFGVVFSMRKGYSLYIKDLKENLTMTTYIYSRVSTEEQNSAQQAKLLSEHYKHDFIVEEKASGKNMDRPKFEKLLAQLKQGDELVVYDVSRVGRNAREILTVAEELKTRGVRLVVHTLGSVDVTSAAGGMILAVFAGFAQMERQNMLERQRIGIDRAKAEGKYKGRNPIGEATIATARRMRVEGASMDEVSKQLKIGVSTLYRLLKS